MYKDSDMKDRWIVVTGASRGVGREVVRCLVADHGCPGIGSVPRIRAVGELKAEPQGRTGDPGAARLRYQHDAGGPCCGTGGHAQAGGSAQQRRCVGEATWGLGVRGCRTGLS